MDEFQTKAYRIPTTGHPYYRAGAYYSPGEIVHVPEKEDPAPGWIELKPGVSEKQQEELSAVEQAEREAAELEAQLAEKRRRLAELTAKAEATAIDHGEESRGIAKDDAAAPDAAKPKKKGRASERDL